MDDDYDLPMKLEESLAEYARTGDASPAGGKERFELFRSSYYQNFSKNTGDDLAAATLIWAVLSEIFVLYYLGLTSSVIIELHAVLEHYARRDLPRLITQSEASRDIVKRLVERRTLSELSQMLVAIDVWNDEHLRFVAHLAKLRNGLAHNSKELLGRILGGKTFSHINDARIAAARVDAVPLLISATDALSRLSTACIEGGVAGQRDAGESSEFRH
jgi:hypothetical protein